MQTALYELSKSMYELYGRSNAVAWNGIVRSPYQLMLSQYH